MGMELTPDVRDHLTAWNKMQSLLVSSNRMDGRLFDPWVPIRLCISLEGILCDETMLWDTSSNTMTYTQCAQILVDELGLTPKFETAIALSLEKQVDNYVHVMSSHQPVDASTGIDIDIPVDIMVEHLHYTTVVTWSLSPATPPVSPEKFAAITCRELGAPESLAAALSHAIREGIYLYFARQVFMDEAIEARGEQLVTEIEEGLAAAEPGGWLGTGSKCWKHYFSDSDDVAALKSARIRWFKTRSSFIRGSVLTGYFDPWVDGRLFRAWLNQMK